MIHARDLDDHGGGNADGTCQYGEVCSLAVELHNTWNEPLAGVSAVLRRAHDAVTLLDSTAGCGTLAPATPTGGLGGDGYAFAIRGDRTPAGGSP